MFWQDCLSRFHPIVQNKSRKMFLNYLSLVILILGLVMVFYAFIYLHDLPYAIAKKHKHPQTEAIHVACWLSLFTLHAIWPIVFIWAIAKGEPANGETDNPNASGVAERINKLEHRLSQLEKPATEAQKGS
jgi:hypothetical protein